ncbi:hypothetical protein ILYODFUR_025067 [Ilyodon furcidens]|uniref:Uncharacterized protein n=1 Tax=Ilyodon furcidens TaxID=33524 RepID=A0ABV0TB41_9TELE
MALASLRLDCTDNRSRKKTQTPLLSSTQALLHGGLYIIPPVSSGLLLVGNSRNIDKRRHLGGSLIRHPLSRPDDLSHEGSRGM